MRSDNGLVPIMQQAIIWANDGPAYWSLHALFGLNELKNKGVVTIP